MEDYYSPEEQPEVLKTDSIKCPNCKYTDKIVFETMRRIDKYKVKPIELMGCKNCGTIFSDVDTLKDIN